MIALGKSFAGKSTVLKRYAEGNLISCLIIYVQRQNKNEFLENGVSVLNVEQLLHEAIDAFNNNESVSGGVRSRNHEMKIRMKFVFILIFSVSSCQC